VTGTPVTAALDRAGLTRAARELAIALREEMAHLERDARAFEVRGNRLFAGQVRDMRLRFARVLDRAERVLAAGGIGTLTPSRSANVGQPDATISKGAAS